MQGTHKIPTEGVVDFVHRPGEVVKLCARLAALLKLTLESAKDVVEGKAAFSWGTHTPAHAAHA